jgi:hypothetical protein
MNEWNGKEEKTRSLVGGIIEEEYTHIETFINIFLYEYVSIE